MEMKRSSTTRHREGANASAPIGTYMAHECNFNQLMYFFICPASAIAGHLAGPNWLTFCNWVY